MPYVDKVKSVKTRGFPNRGERYGAKYENGVAYLLSYIVSVEKLWTRNDLFENFQKKGVVEKRGEEETKSMPYEPVKCD